MRKVPILMLEYSNYLLTANTLYCLSQYKQFEIHFLSRKAKSPFRYSQLVKSFHYFPKEGTDASFLSFAKEVSEKTQAQVMVPTSAPSFRFMIENKTAIQQFIKTIPLPELWAYEVAAEKGQLAEFMIENQIATPLTIYSLSENLEQQLADFPFPALLKPKVGSGGQGASKKPGITRFNDKAKLISFIHQHELEEDYLIQQYIDGFVIGCNVLYINGKLITYTIQKGLVLRENFACSLGIEFINNYEVVELVDKLMSKLKWNGVANLDLIYDNKQKAIKVLEVNPRFWVTVGGSMFTAKINFPALACMMALNMPLDDIVYKTGKYIPLSAFVEYKLSANSNNKVKFSWREIDYRHYLANFFPKLCSLYNQKFG